MVYNNYQQQPRFGFDNFGPWLYSAWLHRFSSIVIER